MKRLGFVLLVAVLAAATRATRVIAFEQHRASQRYEDMYYVPPAEWLPVLSMGFRSALADLLWCRSLVYFGEEMVNRGQVAHAFEYTDAILALDPSFREPYRWISLVALYRGGDVRIEDSLRSVKYLERATERWPNDGELAWDLGSLLRFEIAPLLKDKELRKKLEEQAAQYLTTAALLGAGPKWLALNSSNLLTKLGKTEQAIRHLEEVYGTVQDEYTREVITARLASLRSESHAEAIRTANEQFESERRRAFPYLPAGLFWVIGSKSRAHALKLVANDFLESPAPGMLDEGLEEQGDVPSDQGL